MGIYDRDYMRRDDRPRRQIPIKLIVLVLIGALLLAIAAARYHRHQVPQTGRAKSTPQTARGKRLFQTPGKGSLRVNVNAASEDELQTIPGVGAAKAKSVVEHRPYSSVEDLVNHGAIGNKMLENVRPFVKTDGTTEKITDPE